MKKKTKTTNKASLSKASKAPNKWLIAGIVVVILLALGYLLRGWVRATVLPESADIIYGRSVSKLYQEEMDKLQDPTALLGYGDNDIKAEKDCTRSFASGLKTQIICTYGVEASKQINLQDKDQLNANATKLQDALKANGWQGTYSDTGDPYTSIVKLMSSLTNDIDYQPDATYTKDIGNTTCTLSTVTAYSKPNPSAMATRAYCLRTINFVGDPTPAMPLYSINTIRK